MRQNKFALQTIQSSVTSKFLKIVNVNRAACFDNISVRLLRDGADLLAIPQTQIWNLSIKLSQFPNSCKLPLLKPLYKNDPKTDPKNFRPASFSPCSFKDYRGNNTKSNYDTSS